MDPHKQAYFDLSDQAALLSNQLHGIKANLAPSTATASSRSSHDGMRLPKLELKSFDGSLLEWISFRDMFSSSVHSNTSLSKVQKLTYLNSLLKGEAAKQIQTMVLSDANYDTAWQQLHDRYQNDRELLFAVLRRFHEQQNVPATSSALRSLVDTSKECLRSLEILNLKADKSSEAMMLFVITTKLDSTTRELWEQSLKGTSVPPLIELFDFLEQRARALAAGGCVGVAKSRSHENRKVQVHHGQSNGKCKICNENSHPLVRCVKFNSLSVPEKYEAAKRHHLCFNCLQEGHSTKRCPSSGRCRSCNAKHHTSLHRQPTEPSSNPPSGVSGPPSLALGHHGTNNLEISQTILATAIIRVVGGGGQQHFCRALLDGGSTASFITDSCLTRLGLRKAKNATEVLGLAAAPVGPTCGITSFVFGPRFQSNLTLSVNALVLPKVTGRLPMYPCDPTGWSHLDGLTLADPKFHEPAAIDILLGSDVFWSLLNGDVRRGPSGSPLAISSSLGTLVAGSLASNTSTVRVHVAEVALDRQLQTFWDLESIPSQQLLTDDEKNCEAFFASHHARDDSGRFTVALPLRSPRPLLGNSRDSALHRLKQLERRLARNPEHLQQYVEFMREYQELGHMSLVPIAEIAHPHNPVYYIPHHFVLKADSTTTKFRVVFDASAKTTSGKSLNDCMLVGPTLQDNLVDIVTRFRLYPVAFSADIAKMYRQIRVTSTDADLQRIMWRESPTDEIKEYRLETVSYGTASAPYLAVKVLHQLADDEMVNLPLAAAVAKSSFYVDDLMSSTETVDKGLMLQKEMLELTNRGCLPLRKWVSNNEELIQSLPEELRETKTHLNIALDPMVKTLGIQWNTRQDCFEFQYLDAEAGTGPYTKRIILSEMSKLFDPLGWLSPVVVRAKILMQDLWKIQVDWDQPLPQEVQEFWLNFKSSLKSINLIRITRCMIPRKANYLNLAGFSDASEKAFSAVVYLCAFHDDGCTVSLITSKTRVAPAKKISVPRLELCGAVLLANLMESVKHSLKVKITRMKAWTDSTVVLDWIRSHPSRWQTFVANRVTIIQEVLPEACWSHVPGVENPADCASRGISPIELQSLPLWWNGPPWLKSMDSFATTSSEPLMDDEVRDVILAEERKVVFAATTIAPTELSLLCRYSNLTQLIRTTAWILRIKSQNKPGKLSLTPLELESALNKWIWIIQRQEFGKEIELLQQKLPLPVKSPILCLAPFVDEFGLLRVGGRIRNAVIPQDQKFPVLLPRHSKLTELIILSKHKQHLHAGPNLLLSILQQRFWILRARDAVRFLLKKCVVCTRQAAATQQQFMADLPTSRVTPGRAFKRCGVDCAGPFIIRPILSRSKVTMKAYLALFVCFTTRAFHLEVISSLSTDAFLAAFRRFVSRRGLPSDVHSDCGTNFVGANREMKEMVKLCKSQTHNNQMTNSLANEGVNWHFNPAGAPHFGGLWEAGVKSVKYHLHRIIGGTRLTFEELTTTMAQVEACLNSRPLTPFSTDPSDLMALTSGHFLIGEPLVAVPSPDLTTLNVNKLSRYQLIQNLQQQFWKRWSGEYLTRLQQRPKWLQQRKNLIIGDLVIIKAENMPPQKWKLGRVIAVHPGSDGLVRATTLRTSEGEVKRPIAKLCLLPIFEDPEILTDTV